MNFCFSFRAAPNSISLAVMRVIRGPFLCLPLLLSQSFSVPPENPYDVLGMTIAPFAALFAREGATNRSLELDARLVEASKLPHEFVGQTLHVAVEAPDKLLVRAPVLGETVTLCRHGQELWATPGAKLDS